MDNFNINVTLGNSKRPAPETQCFLLAMHFRTASTVQSITNSKIRPQRASLLQKSAFYLNTFYGQSPITLQGITEQSTNKSINAPYIFALKCTSVSGIASRVY